MTKDNIETLKLSGAMKNSRCRKISLIKNYLKERIERIMPIVSVIIATRNRSEALETISLPSLAKQSFKDFEVIIWDASDDDKSKVVVKNFIKSHPDMVVRYFKAPRTGLPSQRNDAVKVAKGEIIYFIDDDSELSVDAIEIVFKTLHNTLILDAKYQ